MATELRLIQGGRAAGNDERVAVWDLTHRIGPEDLLMGEQFVQAIAHRLGVGLSDMAAACLAEELFHLGLRVTDDIGTRWHDAAQCGTGGRYDQQGRRV